MFNFVFKKKQFPNMQLTILFNDFEPSNLTIFDNAVKK